MKPQLGLIEWFRIGEQQRVENALAALKALGVRHLRTGISWAEWYGNPQARDWYDWLLPRLGKEIELLPCCVETPPAQGIDARPASPPRNTKLFADFVDDLCINYGDCFRAIELWDAPNTLRRWDATLDPDWCKLAETIAGAAFWARKRRKQVVLGGMAPADPQWLRRMFERGVMNYVDAVGVHGYPQSDDPLWLGWEQPLRRIRDVLLEEGSNAEIWITAAGYSTWRHDEQRQLAGLAETLSAPVARIYWHGLQDLPAEQSAPSGFHNDEREYHFGLLRADGSKKLLFRLWEAEGLEQAAAAARLSSTIPHTTERPALIIGGCGPLGASLADRLLRAGRAVLVYDNLADATAVQNLRGLQQSHGALLQVQLGDLRDAATLRTAVLRASEVYYFPQRTVSGDDAFELNVRGTLNLLEALRTLSTPMPLVVASSSEIYGAVDGPTSSAAGLIPADGETAAHGIAADWPLNLKTPAACALATIEQYTTAYARTHGISACVLRLSSVFGPRHAAQQDELSLAPLLQGQRAAWRGSPDDTRDLLYINDALDACLLARDRMPQLAGRIFNLGAGPEQAISLKDLSAAIYRMNAAEPQIVFTPATDSPGYAVLDARPFRQATGWRPQVSLNEGLQRLQDWLREAHPVPREYIRKARRTTTPRRTRVLAGENAS